MDRIYNPDREADDRRFTEGDMELDIEATPLAEAWLNAVQEELCAAATLDGGKLDAKNNAQLSQVIARRATQVAVQQGVYTRCVNTGSADQLVGEFTPPIEEVVDGMVVHLFCKSTNGQAKVSFTPNAASLPSAAVLSITGASLAPGDVPVGWADLRYVESLGSWTLLNRVEAPTTPTACTVEVFASSATYVKPEGAKFIRLKMIGAGAGGSSGQVSPTGTVARGGNGGGGPASMEVDIFAEDLSDTCAVVVGKGGLGGGRSKGAINPGNAGGHSSFSANHGYRYMISGGGISLVTTTGMFPGGAGGQGSTTGAVASSPIGYVANGGAGGGAVNSAGVAFGGGGSAMSVLYQPIGGRKGGDANGGDAEQLSEDSYLAKYVYPGIPGGGGGGNAKGDGGNGGNGYGYGASGGGGGGAIAPNESGAGGHGADGLVVVTTYF